MELTQDIRDRDKGGRLITVVGVDPGEHVALPASRKAAVHRIIEAVVFFARKSKFDPIAAWRQASLQESAPCRNISANWEKTACLLSSSHSRATDFLSMS